MVHNAKFIRRRFGTKTLIVVVVLAAGLLAAGLVLLLR